MWIIAPEVVRQFGDLKKPESANGTGPFLLKCYEPNVKTVFQHNPDSFLKDQPYVDGVEWMVIDDLSTALAMYRTGHQPIKWHLSSLTPHAEPRDLRSVRWRVV